jgi:hypothetical protein
VKKDVAYVKEEIKILKGNLEDVKSDVKELKKGNKNTQTAVNSFVKFSKVDIGLIIGVGLIRRIARVTVQERVNYGQARQLSIQLTNTHTSHMQTSYSATFK